MYRILAYLRHFPAQITLNVLFNLLHILCSLGAYVLIIPFVELMFGLNGVPEAEPEFAFNQKQMVDWAFWHLYQYKAVHGIWGCLIIVAAGYVGCSLLSNFFRFMAQVFLGLIRNGLIEYLRNDIYHKVTILPVAFFNSKRRGDLMSRMSNDIADMEWCVGVLQSLVKEPLNIVVFATILLFVSWRLFVLFLLVLPLGVWMIARIGKRLKNNSQRGQKELGRLSAILEESLASLKAIKAFGREDNREDVFAKANARYGRTMVKVARSRELSSPLSEILGTLALVFILIIGGWQVIDGSIQPSVFIFFVIIFARIIPPIQAIVRTYNTLQKGTASAERFLEILDADEVILEKPNAMVLQGFEDKIEFHDVCFSYTDTPVLSHINLVVPKGKTIAIVGPSGAGKTTLSSTCCRVSMTARRAISLSTGIPSATSTSTRCGRSSAWCRRTAFFSTTPWPTISPLAPRAIAPKKFAPQPMWPMPTSLSTNCRKATIPPLATVASTSRVANANA